MNIWYFHHYGGGPGIGRAYRPYDLGQAWLKAGHQVTVFIARFHHHLDKPEPQPLDQTIEGLRYVALPARHYDRNGVSRILNMVDYAIGVLRLGDRRPPGIAAPDAVIVSSPHPFSILSGYRLARKFKCRLVFEVRDLWPLSIIDVVGAPRWHPFVLLCGWIERFAYTRADVVVSLLAGVGRYIQDIGLPAKPFCWAPNGVVAHPRAQVLTSAHGQEGAKTIGRWKAEGRAVVIHAGAIGPPNGVETFIDAVALANARVSSRLSVLVLGDGVLAEAVRERARDLHNVAFISSVPKGEALALIASSDIGYVGALSHDNLYRYGTSSNKVMDYMLCGLPVLFPVKAYRDPVRESGGGVAVDVSSPETIAEALVSLVEAGEEGRRLMGEKGRAYVVANYGWDDIAARYIEAIKPD